MWKTLPGPAEEKTFDFGNSTLRLLCNVDGFWSVSIRETRCKAFVQINDGYAYDDTLIEAKRRAVQFTCDSLMRIVAALKDDDAEKRAFDDEPGAALFKELNAAESETQLAQLAPLIGRVGWAGLWRVRSKLDKTSALKLLKLLGAAGAAAAAELESDNLESTAHRRLLLDTRALAQDFLAKHWDLPAVGAAEISAAAAALRDARRPRR